MKNLKKQATFTKKLQLKKEAIAALNSKELNVLWGGIDSVMCTMQSACCQGPYSVEIGCHTIGDC